MDESWTSQVERRLHALEMRNAVDEVHRLAVERRLGAIEDMLKWLVRLVFGALLTAAVAYALRGGFFTP
ncbi:MAG: pseudouridine synthase [Pseudomonadota bacterium]